MFYARASGFLGYSETCIKQTLLQGAYLIQVLILYTIGHPISPCLLYPHILISSRFYLINLIRRCLFRVLPENTLFEVDDNPTIG